MKYPKQVMTIAELKKMGFSKGWLRKICRDRDQEIAWQKDKSKPNSPFLFSTEELEKYRKAQCTGV